jgi:hypothetical protein
MPPSDSAPINSIVNMWVVEKQKTAVAWIYKTAAGAYYVQFTSEVSPADARKMGMAPRFTANPFGRQEYGPQPVTTKQLVSIEAAVLGSGASLSGCFAHDLSMPRAH